MSFFKRVKLLFQIKSAVDAVETEIKMGYDFKVGAAKALRDLAITSIAVLAGYFAAESNLVAVLGFLPDTVERAVIPLVSAALVFTRNWALNRK